MNLAIAILLLLLVSDPAVAQDKKKKQPTGMEKILRSMFPSSQPAVSTVKRKSAKKKAGARPAELSLAVEPEWMAHYWEAEAAWDYYIPEDDLIKFRDGKYIVPILVYRHNEDMANSPRRSPTPTPTVTAKRAFE